MSRARAVGGLWFDVQKNHTKATSTQLELLSAADDIPLDDLLDEGLRQGEVIMRLRQALGEGVIPPEILERKRLAKELSMREPKCRICAAYDWQCEGNITRHHFVPRWMMLMLDNYVSYASREKCTIPICLGRHRDLHLRGDLETPKSIVQFLNEEERKFAQKMLSELRDQHFRVFNLILGGDENTYEYVLLRDYMLSNFHKSHASSESKTLSQKWDRELVSH